MNNQTPAQLHTNLINTINGLYKTGDKIGVIDKTMLAIELGLEFGMNSGTMTIKMIDLGVRPEELGTAVSLALMRTDDPKLCDTDKIIKKEAKRIWEAVTH